MKRKNYEYVRTVAGEVYSFCLPQQALSSNSMDGIHNIEVAMLTASLVALPQACTHVLGHAGHDVNWGMRADSGAELWDMFVFVVIVFANRVRCSPNVLPVEQGTRIYSTSLQRDSFCTPQRVTGVTVCMCWWCSRKTNLIHLQYVRAQKKLVPLSEIFICYLLIGTSLAKKNIVRNICKRKKTII